MRLLLWTETNQNLVLVGSTFRRKDFDLTQLLATKPHAGVDRTVLQVDWTTQGLERTVTGFDG